VPSRVFPYDIASMHGMRANKERTKPAPAPETVFPTPLARPFSSPRMSALPIAVVLSVRIEVKPPVVAFTVFCRLLVISVVVFPRLLVTCLTGLAAPGNWISQVGNVVRGLDSRDGRTLPAPDPNASVVPLTVFPSPVVTAPAPVARLTPEVVLRTTWLVVPMARPPTP
jgi:hypothetical protein